MFQTPQFGLADVLASPASSLSVSVRQLMFAAAAFVSNARVIVLDEVMCTVCVRFDANRHVGDAVAPSSCGSGSMGIVG
jgi:ABC-type multidrug transport system fused ATPase/permease subunit